MTVVLISALLRTQRLGEICGKSLLLLRFENLGDSGERISRKICNLNRRMLLCRDNMAFELQPVSLDKDILTLSMSPTLWWTCRKPCGTIGGGNMRLREENDGRTRRGKEVRKNPLCFSRTNPSAPSVMVSFVSDKNYLEQSHLCPSESDSRHKPALCFRFGAMHWTPLLHSLCHRCLLVYDEN